ncbi:MAG: caspase family protein [Proteobacteria bacterium]|nr:caspase family protein [Pseudomonadota bacterium]
MPVLSRNPWRLLMVLTAAVLLQPAGLGRADAEPRVALVIGNADYGGELGRLANPVNDATLMAGSLTQAGFDVIAVTDADQKAMKRAIGEFGEKLTSAGADVTALFYYSGHGLQVAGENYLIPVHAEIKREADVDLEAISADTVLKQMQFADSRVNIIILDACRNNPLPRSFRSAEMGLARIEAPRGSFVAYSTAPGDVATDGKGANSPYTAALAKAIVTPGLSIEEAFRDVRGSVLSETGNAQTPWESSSLTAPFYFTPANKSAQSVAQAAAADGSSAQPAQADQGAREVELAFWNSVKDSKDPADFVAYLEQYPKGNFARLAHNKLNLLTGNTAPVSAPARDTQVAETGEAADAEQMAAAPATPPADAPLDPKAAADMCRDDKVPGERRLAACQMALTATGLDAATRADLNNEVGRAQYGLQKYDAAEAAYREAVKYDAANPNYISNLAAVLSDSGRYDEAIAAYTRAIELEPKNNWHYYNRGNAYLYTGDPAKAAADLDAALAIDESFDLLATRGYMALAEGDEKAAIEFTNRAIAYDGSRNSLQSIAVLYLSGRDKDAIDMADRLVAEDDGYGYGQIWKAMLLSRDGKSGAARTLLGNTLQKHREDWPGMLIKWMLGKFDDETLITKAHEGSAEDIRNQLCEAHFYMAARAFDQGDKAATLTHVKAALETKVYHYIEYYAAAALQRQLEGGN